MGKGLRVFQRPKALSPQEKKKKHQNHNHNYDEDNLAKGDQATCTILVFPDLARQVHLAHLCGQDCPRTSDSPALASGVLGGLRDLCYTPLLSLSLAKGSRALGQKYLSQALQLPFLSYVVNIAVNHLSVLSLDFSKKSLSIRAVGLSSMRSKQGTFRGRAQSTSGMGPTGNSQAAFLSATEGWKSHGWGKARSSAPCSHRVLSALYHARLLSASGRQDSVAEKSTWSGVHGWGN